MLCSNVGQVFHTYVPLSPSVSDDLSINHGGVAIVSSGGISMSPVAAVDALQPGNFECVCSRVTCGQFVGIVVALYRPGSSTVLQQFYDELGSLLEHVATYQVPVYITGDFDVRLDRRDDTHATQLRQLIDCYALLLHDTEPAHQLGGTLDVVVTHDDFARGDLAVPRSRTTRYGQRCFAVSGPTLWNSLPLSVRDPSLTLTQFCARLKTVLFCRA